MAQIKRLEKKNNTEVIKIVLTSDDGLKFGLGFFAAFTIFAVIVFPVIACVLGLITRSL